MARCRAIAGCDSLADVHHATCSCVDHARGLADFWSSAGGFGHGVAGERRPDLGARRRVLENERRQPEA